MKKFKTELIKEEAGRLTYITIPFNAKDIFNQTKGTIYVKGSVNDIPYRAKLLSRGNNEQIMVIDKEMQKSLGFKGNKILVNVIMELENNESKNTVPSKKNDFDTCNTDVFTAITTRRSIRKFKSKPISDITINTILYAGLCAPSANNKRPFHFIVIKKKEILNELSKNNSKASMLGQAACGIIICGDRNVQGIKELLYNDCSAATQNILLCIHGLGLGGVWCGVNSNSEWSKLITQKIKLPLKVEPIAVIALGFPNEEKIPVDRFEKEKIHFESW